MTYTQINAVIANMMEIDEMLKMVDDTYDMVLETGKAHKNARARVLRGCKRIGLTEEEWLRWFYEDEEYKRNAPKEG